MCFRPSGVSLPVKCDECGTFNENAETECKNCGADLTAAIEAQAASIPGMPAVPGAPGAPATPGAPGIPAAPGVTKAPGTTA